MRYGRWILTAKHNFNFMFNFSARFYFSLKLGEVTCLTDESSEA